MSRHTRGHAPPWASHAAAVMNTIPCGQAPEGGAFMHVSLLLCSEGGWGGQQGYLRTYLSRCGCYSPWSGRGAPRMCCHHAEPQVNHTIALASGPRSHSERSSWPSGTRWTSPRPLEQQPSISTGTIRTPEAARRRWLTWTRDRVAGLLLLAVPGAAPAAVGDGGQGAVAAAEPSPEPDVVHVVEARLAAFGPAGPRSPRPLRHIWTGERQRTPSKVGERRPFWG